MSTTVHEIFKAVQYDGSNGTAIASELGVSVTFDNGTTLVVAGVEVPQTYWLIWTFHPTSGAVIVHEVVTNAQYLAQYAEEIELPPAPELTVSTGSAAVAAMALGGTQDVDVTMSPALPDTFYVPIPRLQGTPALLSQHTISAVTVIDEDTVRIQVTSTIGSLAGATAHVVALALT